jgi:protein TonB
MMRNSRKDIPDFDDLLFESRNKEYGAYQLRKRYTRVLGTGILIAILIACAVVILPFVINPSDDQVLSGGMGSVQVSMEVLEPPTDVVYIPPAPPPPEPERLQEIVKYVAPEIVDTVPLFENTMETIDEFLAQSPDSLPESTGSGTGNDMFPGEGFGDSEEPFFLVEVMPMFRGGNIDKFREWIYKRTNYPQEAIDAKIRGTVFLTFIIEKDGSVSNVTVLKGVHPLLDNEAVKAISESPNWTPGLQRGQPVRVRFQIPMNFLY